MFYQVKRKIYYLLTETNAEVAFQADLFLKDNSDWIMKNPVKYALCLVKMNIDQMMNRSKIREVTPGINSLSRLAKRQRVYQISGLIAKTNILILDLFDLLFIRVNLDNGKKAYILNEYVKKVIAVAKSENIRIIGIGSEYVSDRKTRELLKKYGIELDEVRTPKFHKKKALMKTLLREINSNEQEMLNVYPCLVLSSDFENTIKVVREKYGHAIYYRSIERMMDMVIGDKVNSEFGNIHRAITGLEIFNGEMSHSRIFECAYMLFAPVLYTMMENINFQKGDRQVIILGDEENIFSSLYQCFYGEAKNIPWSSLVANIPETEEEWDSLLRDCPALEVLSADRVGYAMGFSAELDKISDCQEEFISLALSNRKEDRKAIVSYVKRALSGKDKILLVDSIGEEKGLASFMEIAAELEVDVEVVSILEYLYEDEEIIREYKKLFSLAVPYMIGIYEEGFGFAYPQNDILKKKQIIEGAVIKYIQQLKEIKNQYKKIKIATKEDTKVISHVDPSCFRNMTDGGRIV